MKKQERKCFIFNLDETLLNSNNKISKTNIEAIQKANKKGHVLIITTGHNYYDCQYFLKENWGLFNYFIGCNGSIIYSINSRQALLENDKINFKLISEIKNLLIDKEIVIQVSTEWYVFVDQLSDEKTEEFDFIPIAKTIDEMNEIEKKSILQISINVKKEDIKTIYNKLVELCGKKYNIAITNDNKIDININGVNKFIGIKEIVKMEDITYKNVFVFGNSQNDIEILDYYNFTYAMKGSLPEVKEVAKFIIGSNNSNDIAKIVLKNS